MVGETANVCLFLIASMLLSCDYDESHFVVLYLMSLSQFIGQKVNFGSDYLSRHSLFHWAVTIVPEFDYISE